MVDSLGKLITARKLDQKVNITCRIYFYSICFLCLLSCWEVAEVVVLLDRLVIVPYRVELHRWSINPSFHRQKGLNVEWREQTDLGVVTLDDTDAVHLSSGSERPVCELSHSR